MENKKLAYMQTSFIRVFFFCKDIGRSAEGLEVLCEYCRNAFG